jgi:prepilin-type N-terminal cleavage/methylation domain-containing protein
MKHFNMRKQAFTLVELLVVIAIIGITHRAALARHSGRARGGPALNVPE